MKRVLMYSFAGIGTGIAVIIVLGYLFAGRTDYNIESKEQSPDGAHLAIVYSAMGGGAAGWCNLRVAVTANKGQFEPEKEKNEYDNMVFEVSCSSNVKLHWKDNNKLVIKYAWPSNENSIRLWKRAMSADHAVIISYIEN